MSDTRIGTCGNCGGSVMGWAGAWWGVQPPPPPRCTSCGAVPAYCDDTIPMAPRRGSDEYVKESRAALDALVVKITQRGDA